MVTADTQKIVLSWQAQEYPYHEKSHRWFIVAALILSVLVVYGLMTDGWTFSLALVVFAGTYYVLHRNVPDTVDVHITDINIHIGKNVFPFSSIKGFWLVNKPPEVRRLYLRFCGRMRPDLHVELGESDAADVRKILLDHIKEIKGAQEPLSDTIVRILKL